MPNIKDELRKFHEQKQKLPNIYSGSLGVLINGEKVVEVPNRPGFVFVRLQNMQSEFVQALNGVVSPVYDLPVLVTHNNSYYAIYGRDVNRYSNWVTNSSYVPAHHAQHEFDPSNNGGGDVVWVHGEQFYPLLGFPSGSLASNNLMIAPYNYFYGGEWKNAGNTGTANLLTYKPTGSASAKLVLVSIDAATTSPAYHESAEFPCNITGSSAIIQNMPTLDVLSEIPIAAVRLVTGTSSITWAEIIDVRQYFGIMQSAATSFTALTDTPASYVGSSLKAVRVNASATGLEFTNFPSGGGDADLSKILLVYGAGSGTVSYDPTDAGLDQALSASSDLSKIILPPITLNSPHAVIAKNIEIVGTRLWSGGNIYGTTFVKPITFNNEDISTTVALRDIAIYGTTVAFYFTGSLGNGETDLYLRDVSVSLVGIGEDIFVFKAATSDDYTSSLAQNSYLGGFSTLGDSHEYLIESPDGNVYVEMNFCDYNGIVAGEGNVVVRSGFFNEMAITGTYNGSFFDYSDRSFFFVDGTAYDEMHSYDIYNDVLLRHTPVPTVTGSFAYVSDLAQGWKEQSFENAVVAVLQKHGLL